MFITEIPIIWVVVLFVLTGMGLEICDQNSKLTNLLFF
jgi:hypothetical protein